MTLWAGRGQWVKSSLCTTSGNIRRCRSVGSGCRWGSGASTPPQLGTAARRWTKQGVCCIPRTFLTWHQRRSSTLWTSWRSSLGQSNHDFDWFDFFIWPTFFYRLSGYFLFFYFIWNISRCQSALFHYSTLSCYLFNIFTLFIRFFVIKFIFMTLMKEHVPW